MERWVRDRFLWRLKLMVILQKIFGFSCLVWYLGSYSDVG